MAKLKLLSTIFSKLGSLTKNNGQIIVTRDSKSLYIDLEGERIEITDWIDIDTEESLLAILSPLINKYYYTKDTNKIWRYINGEWKCLNTSVNDLTPTYTESSTLVKLSSGEKLSVSFGKISKAITDLIFHIGDSIKHITNTERTNWDLAKTHADSTHARTDATKVEKSSTNGNIKINGTETTVYTHPSGTNPHGTTKGDVGLGNVGNFKAVSTVASQGLSDTEKSNARANIGAGTSSFSGSYNDLTDKPTIPSVDGLVSEDTLNTTLGTKVDKVNGKGLSTNDLTDDLKAGYDDAVDKVHTHPDPLAEKTVVFLGDSITVGLRWQTEIGDTTNKYGWAKIIQEHFPTATVKNLAISGACIANTGNYIDVIMQYHSMSNTENADYYTPNPDYIIFSGGGNDGLQTITMGTICDGFAPSIYNTNTTIGALEYMFADSYNKYPTARKGFIITQRITDAVEEYYDAIRNVCQKWSIPVLDLSRVGEINAFIDGIATTYFTTDDRVHPNEKCYREILAPKVEKWLMSQMI